MRGTGSPCDSRSALTASKSLMGFALILLLQSVLNCSLCYMALLHWLWIGANALPLLVWHLCLQVAWVVTLALCRISHCFSCGIFGSPVREDCTGSDIGAVKMISVLLSGASPMLFPHSNVFSTWVTMNAVTTEQSPACLADPIAWT